MGWVGHLLDTPILSTEPHPQTATMSGWSMELGCSVCYMGVTMARLLDSGVGVAGGEKG